MTLLTRIAVVGTLSVVGVLAGVRAASATPLLINAGFETGSLAPWFANSGSPTVTSAEAHSGTFSVAAFSSDSIQQNFAATPTSLITEVSIWVKRSGGPFDQYTFYYSDLSTASFLINAIGGGDDWLQFDLTGNLAVGKSLTGFSIFGTSAGPAYFDDVRIEASASAVPEPASLTLLGLGLSGVWLARRARR